MIGSIGRLPSVQSLSGRITALQRQLDQSISEYRTTGSKSALLAALRIQTEISEALLNAASLNSPSLNALNAAIKRLT